MLMRLLPSVAIPVNARLLADLFSLDIRSQENPKGTLSISEVYKVQDPGP